jgi:hypothetical protein
LHHLILRTSHLLLFIPYAVEKFSLFLIRVMTQG